MTIKNAMETYNIPEITTTEKLECDGFDKLLIYGDKVLAPGKTWIKNEEGNYVVAYFGTTYEFTTDNHTCEGEIKLKAVSDAIFKDNGHAVAWAMQQ